MQTQQLQLQELLASLEAVLTKDLDTSTANQLLEFAEHLLTLAPLDELSSWRQEKLSGILLHSWAWGQKFSKQAAKVKVFNPSLDQNGWSSARTVIQLVNVDRLLLIESLIALLQDRNLHVHTLLNGVYTVERDAEGQLVDILATKESNADNESWALVEIEQLAAEDLAKLQADIEALLAEVDVAAEDFSAMREQVLAASTALEAAEKANASLAANLINPSEASAFLQLIADHHFVFLGYDQHQLEEQAGQQVLTKVAGSELGLFKLGHAASLNNLPEELISFSQAPATSGALRTSYPDQILIKTFDSQGKVQGVQRFIGLYSPSFYSRTPRDLPILRKKITNLMQALGVEAVSHNGRQLLQVLDTYPQDDLLNVSPAELTETVLNIFKLRNRRKTRAFIRQNLSSQLYSVLVYLPKSSFNVQVEKRIQDFLSQALDAKLVKSSVYFSTTTLCRIQLTLHFDKLPAKEYSVKALSQQVKEITSTWDDLLHLALQEELGQASANRLLASYQQAFSAAYYENFNAQQGAKDIQYLENLSPESSLNANLYQPLTAAENQLGLKIYSLEQQLSLYKILPLLSNLGLQVVSQNSYQVQPAKASFWVYDFQLEINQAGFDLGASKDKLQEALVASWQGLAENDVFNQLVTAASLGWREASVFRAYGQYLQQIGSQDSLEALAKCLLTNPQSTALLAQLFQARFNPETANAEQEAALVAQLEELIEATPSRTNTRILQAYLELIQATLRTNFFQKTAADTAPEALSFKLKPAAISAMPKPRPMFEIFVSSARVEGVHLRYGTTARGGLRWSDRDDYRTETLGLVKAQQVKNAVIVPVGAKGGFICKQMPASPSRDEFMAEGETCYKIFIGALLDVTDNLDGKTLIPPANLVRHDADDPYLVVAADKGTATFSDLANSVAAEYNFWLGDAFASGGSDGYDHKKMGITASGAWVNVQRHFRELGLNTQEETFSVVGIGDMSGDVFGNGMLQSDKILLCAAFNHLHIFVDPNPADSVASFNERKRLFALPRSSWADYKASLISAGGGIFERSAKSINISPEMQERFGITAKKLTPDELISALLIAPVDLIWNGGIGTYVKSSQETHASVGDKGNDAVRVDGAAMRCRVIGEGGNLGFTQAARIEAALKGISVNADFIDNAGGVNCSDHEVNIKILLQEVVHRGDLTPKQRNKLLVDMTDEVASLVVRDNYTQSQALALAEKDSQANLSLYSQLITHLEANAGLDRQLEFLPSSQQLEARAAQNLGLTRPELAVLLAYTKAEVKNLILATDLPDDPWLGQAIKLGFPKVLVENYAKCLNTHRLKRELIATFLTNQMLDRLGLTFVYRFQQEAGFKIQEIVRAYAASRDICGFIDNFNAIENLDYQVAASLQLDLMQQQAAMLERTCTWLIENRFVGTNAEQTITNFKPSVESLLSAPEKQLNAEQLEAYTQLQTSLSAAGIAAATAQQLALANFLDAALIKE